MWKQSPFRAASLTLRDRARTRAVPEPSARRTVLAVLRPYQLRRRKSDPKAKGQPSLARPPPLLSDFSKIRLRLPDYNLRLRTLAVPADLRLLSPPVSVESVAQAFPLPSESPVSRIFLSFVSDSLRPAFCSLLVKDCSSVADNHATAARRPHTYICVQIVHFLCITQPGLAL